ncbi:MAG: EAL domain-containing protein [Candidatus Dactylopiibacterium sp.]|nr:EAL domain-containing protein [Candidatus Dactylopiibacterium sp.]
MQDDSPEDVLEFADEPPPGAHPAPRSGWRILIVDDDPDVHATTTFALRGADILGRPLEFLHAHSAAQASALLAQERDIAVVLLDMVMEEDDSGLRLVRHIRETLGLAELRIILRTGQPGYAPEMDAIRDHDINDYKTKSELTRSRLLTALITAVRSYQQIHALNVQRRGLDYIARVGHALPAAHSLEGFASVLVPMLCDLLGARAAGAVCLATPDGPLVLAASGDYAGDTLPAEASARLAACLAGRHHVFSEQACCLYLEGDSTHQLAVLLALTLVADDPRLPLLDAFCASISIGLRNALLLNRLEHFAYRDALTGLANRQSLIDALDASLAGPDAARLTLVVLDLDGFGESNDSLGHQHGDALLVAVAHRLKEALGDTCTLARLSGDTFAVLGPHEALDAGRLTTLFEAPFRIPLQDVAATASFGALHLADCDNDGASALKSAYFALRRAKSESRGDMVYFTPAMASAIRARARLLLALRQAVEHRHLYLCFQPQVALPAGTVCGVEALLRWRNESGREVGPADFIPLAEQSGLIVGIGEWVLRSACAEQARLAAAGFADLTMGLNVSVRQLRHPNFLGLLRDALTSSGADPARIELEITESMAMEEADAIESTLEGIKQLGVRVAIDDFGTGFSSLSYLQRLRVDRLKIDRSFVADLSSGERARQVPEAVIQLGHRLGLTIMAEGVETEAQAHLLAELGCDEAQGYLYSRPLENGPLLAWLQAQPTRG